MFYFRGRNDSPLQLDITLNEEGFQDARLYHFKSGLELAKANSEQHLLVVEKFASRLARADNTDEASQLNRLVQAGYKEQLEEAALYMPQGRLCSTKSSISQ